jgi:hypothetical protein
MANAVHSRSPHDVGQAHPITPNQRYSPYKHVYYVETIFTTSVKGNVFETNRKRLLVRAQRFPSYQAGLFTPAPTTSK